MQYLFYLLVPSFYAYGLSEKLHLEDWLAYLLCAQSFFWFLAYRYRNQISSFQWGAIALISFLFVIIAPANEANQHLADHINTYTQSGGLIETMSPYLYQFLKNLSKKYENISVLVSLGQLLSYVLMYFCLSENYMRKKLSDEKILCLCVMTNPLFLYFFIFKFTYQMLIMSILVFSFNISHYLWRSIFSSLLSLVHPLGFISLPHSATRHDNKLVSLFSMVPILLIFAISYFYSPLRTGLYIKNMFFQSSPWFFDLAIYLRFCIFVFLSLAMLYWPKKDQKYIAHQEFLVVLLSMFLLFDTATPVVLLAILYSFALSPSKDMLFSLLLSIFLLATRFFFKELDYQYSLYFTLSVIFGSACFLVQDIRLAQKSYLPSP